MAARAFDDAMVIPGTGVVDSRIIMPTGINYPVGIRPGIRIASTIPHIAFMSNQPSTETATNAMVEFIRSIGIGVHDAELQHETFLPGVSPRGASLLVDRARLLYPGDLLHEAGHIACAPPERREIFEGNAGDDPAEEMMAIAWSYAAALHIGLDPAIVFHEHGYKGGSAAILENFQAGRTIGVPMLQWVGMSFAGEEAASRGVAPYPAMVRWIR